MSKKKTIKEELTGSEILETKKGEKVEVNKEGFEVVETGVSDLPQETIKWQGENIEVKSSPLVDEGEGKAVLIRHFFFQLPPRPAGVPFPSKEALINYHRPKIQLFLWKDGFEMVEDVRFKWRKELPAGNLKKVMTVNKIPFVIMAVCQAKKGLIIREKPTTLQEITQNAFQKKTH